MDVTRKVVVAVVLTAGMVGVGAGSAAAGAFTHSTTGIKINGTYVFEPDSVRYGPFHWYGTLEDTENDGNAGKVQVRVEGYGYATFYNNKDKDKYWDELVYDPQATRTDLAHAKICRDRGSLRPDNCSTERKYTR